MSGESKIRAAARDTRSWLALVIGVGLASSVAWVAVLGWLLVRAVHLIR